MPSNKSIQNGISLFKHNQGNSFRNTSANLLAINIFSNSIPYALTFRTTIKNVWQPFFDILCVLNVEIKLYNAKLQSPCTMKDGSLTGSSLMIFI